MDYLEIGQGHTNGNGGPVRTVLQIRPRPTTDLSFEESGGGQSAFGRLLWFSGRRVTNPGQRGPVERADERAILVRSDRGTIFGGWGEINRDRLTGRVHVRFAERVHKRMTTASCLPSNRLRVGNARKTYRPSVASPWFFSPGRR